jgi:hypothetical protein
MKKKLKLLKNMIPKVVLNLIMILMISCNCSRNVKINPPQAPEIPKINFKFYNNMHYLNDLDAGLFRDWLIDYYYFLEEYDLYKETINEN